MTDERKDDRNESQAPKSDTPSGGVSRRGALKALASVPFFGAFAFSFGKKKAADDFKKKSILSELGVSESGPAYIPNAISKPPSERLRLGIIGFGGEGESLVRYAGFAHPDWVEEQRKAVEENPAAKETTAAGTAPTLKAVEQRDRKRGEGSGGVDEARPGLDAPGRGMSKP